MPELAEVEWFRKQWDPGLRQKITSVSLHEKARIFRGLDPAELRRALTGSLFQSSEAGGKQMLFRFSRGGFLGLHLGMTGRLTVEPPDFTPARHDHLVLFQKKRALVFRDARMFGRVRFATGKSDPAWWAGAPPGVLSAGFTPARVAAFLRRHSRLPLKAALLLQTGFPGLGNWMVDEILWQARLHPRRPSSSLSRKELTTLRQKIRAICRTALKTVGHDFADPPAGWLFHERWKRKGECPRHGLPLETAQVGGRTTRWCAKCQPAVAAAKRRPIRTLPPRK